jgi:uncharacterized coiled-coil DUF342 family protein
MCKTKTRSEELYERAKALHQEADDVWEEAKWTRSSALRDLLKDKSTAMHAEASKLYREAQELEKGQ